MTTSRRRAPAVRLLDSLLEASKMDGQALGHSLGVSESELDAFRSGAQRMPAEQRLRLASLVVVHAPQYVRAAQQLKQSAEAELAFRNTTNVAHLNTPPSRFRS